MRVVVLVGVVADDDAGGLEVGDHVRVGVEDVLALVVGDLGGEAAAVVDRTHQHDAVRFAHPLVVLAEAGCHVDDAGTVVVGDEVAAEHDEAVLPAGEVGQQRLVGEPGQLRSGEGAEHLVVLAEVLGVALERARADQHPGAGSSSGADLDHRVADVGAGRERQVGRQGPRRGRPRPDLGRSVAEQLGDPSGASVGGDGERHGERGVLAGAGGVVEADLEVRQRGLGPPRVRHDPVGLVDQALVPQLLEGPDHRLHVREVHGLVVVREVDPAGLACDVALPLVGVAQHRGAAEIVEAVDAVGGDGGAAGDAGLLLDHHLGRQAVAVPAEATLDPLAPHGLVAGDDVLDVAGQQVAVVGEPVGERRPVVEDELVIGGTLLDGAFEGLLLLPAVEQALLQRRQVGPRRDGGIRLIGRAAGGRRSRIHGRSRVVAVPGHPGGGSGRWRRSAPGFWRHELERALLGVEDFADDGVGARLEVPFVAQR